MQAASAVEYPGKTNPLGTPDVEDGLDLVQLRKQFTDYATVKMEEIDENRQSNRYYHGEQLTETQRKVINPWSGISSETAERMEIAKIYPVGTPTTYLNAHLTVDGAW